MDEPLNKVDDPGGGLHSGDSHQDRISYDQEQDRTIYEQQRSSYDQDYDQARVLYFLIVWDIFF